MVPRMDRSGETVRKWLSIRSCGTAKGGHVFRSLNMHESCNS